MKMTHGGQIKDEFEDALEKIGDQQNRQLVIFTGANFKSKFS